MSIDLVAATMWLPMEPARKLVLLALCERADIQTGYCFPGEDEISVRSSLSRRSVVPHLKALIGDGYVKNGKRPNRKGMYQKRWVNVRRIIAEGDAARDRFKAVQQERWETDADAPPEWASEDVAHADSSHAEQVKNEPPAGEASVPASEVERSPHVQIGAVASEAASPVTVIEPSLAPSSETVTEPSTSRRPRDADADAWETWERVKTAVGHRTTRQNADTWLRDTYGLRSDGFDTLVVAVPSSMARDWLTSRLKTVIHQALIAECGGDVSLSFEVRAPPGRRQ